MLDVHPPHEAAHSWRDFLIHIATITIGLLIALSLEGLVEAVHHRHMVAEARENLRREIAENRELLAKDKRGLEGNAAVMRRNVAVLDSLAKRMPGDDPGAMSFPWYWSAPSSAAWQTARESGALTLMPYEELQRFTVLYGQQGFVNQDADTYIHDVTVAGNPLRLHAGVKELTPAEIEEMRRGCANALGDIENLEALIKFLELDYNAMLKEL